MLWAAWSTTFGETLGRVTRVLGGVALTLVLAGCWPMPGQNPDRTSYNDLESQLTPANVAGLEETWTFTAPVPTSYMWPAAISSAGVYVARRCRLSTLDPATGSTLWSADTYPDASSFCAVGSGMSFGDSLAPFVVGDTVYIGSSKVSIAGDGSPTGCDGITSGFASRPAHAAASTPPAASSPCAAARASGPIAR